MRTEKEKRTASAVLKVRNPGMMLERLAGMLLIERQLFVLSRAGCRRVQVTAPRPAAPLRLPPELKILWASDQGRAEYSVSPTDHRELEVSGDHLFRVETVRAALAAGTSLSDPAAGCDDIEVRSPSDKPRALSWLLAGARKNSDGFMARLFDRHLSLFLTRRLLDTPLRPNHMTLVSTFIGLAGAGQFYYAQRGHELLGSILIWLHTVLDGCDGEMARLTCRESRWGALLDFWGDNVVHVALFAGLAVDLRRSEPMAPLLGVLACLGTLGSALGSAWLARRNRARTQTPEPANPILGGVARLPTAASGMSRRLQKLEVLLAQRDFIYLLVLCSMFNHEEDFLWAAGLGAPLYLLIMVYIYRQSKRAAAAKDLAHRMEQERWVPASARG